MDTLESELQSLRAEIAQLRDENITMFKEVWRQNEIFLKAIISLREKEKSLHGELVKQHVNLHQMIAFFGGVAVHDNLNKYLNRLAGMQSAEFIVNEMPKVKSLNNLQDYHRYILAQTEKFDGGGLYLEFGVYKGGSINFISSILPDEIIYGFDSFEGLPEDWRYDLQKGGFNVDGNLPPVNKNVRLIKGWFNEHKWESLC